MQATTKKLQVTTKNIKKEDKTLHETPALEALCAKGFFKFNILFLVLTFQMTFQYPI